jgi:hypothetical protein
MKKNIVLIILVLLISCSVLAKKRKADSVPDAKKDVINEEPFVYQGEPLRVGIISLVHDHVGWILGREKFGDIEIVGIVIFRKLEKRFSIA